MRHTTSLGIDEKTLIRAQTGEDPPEDFFFSLRDEQGALLVILVFAVGVYSVRCLLHPIFGWMYRLKMGSSATYKNERKFRECAWYTTYYVTGLTFATMVASREAYNFFDMPQIWINYPLHPFSFLFRLYYLFELAFYVQALVALFLETRTDDFVVLVAHHVATIILVLGSYMCRYQRIGLLILILHDISDVFLYGAKMVKYIELTTITNMCFGAFAVSFFLCRLYLFPVFAIRSAAFDSLSIGRHIPLHAVTNVCLVALLIMHCYWWVLIMRIILKMWRGQGVQDIREDDAYERGRREQLERAATCSKENIILHTSTSLKATATSTTINRGWSR